MNVERNYGIDLLRIVSMFMVVILHILGRGGILANTKLLSFHYEVAWLLEILCYCAVNSYALISGYVGINSQHKYTNLIMLWLQTFFYTFIISIIFGCLKIVPFDFNLLLKAIFPLSTKSYWYFNAYTVLFIFIPIINNAINNIDKRQLRFVIYALSVLFVILPTVFRTDLFEVNGGYSGIWLIFLYILGGYIKKYNVLEKITPKKAVTGYLIFCLATWLFKLIMEIVTINILGSAKGGGVFISYISPTILFASIMLLALFEKLHISEFMKKVITYIAPTTFGIYLIHVNPLIWDNMFKNRFVKFINMPILFFIISVIVTAICIFIVCSAIDFGRKKLFDKISIKKSIQKI